jgi:hypothetical protein
MYYSAETFGIGSVFASASLVYNTAKGTPILFIALGNETFKIGLPGPAAI